MKVKYAELWYCSHCGKRQEGGRRRDVFTECMNRLHDWLEGEDE